METPAPTASHHLLAVAAAVAALIGALTFARYGLDAVGSAWVAVQLFLVVVAAVDVTTRRIPNRLVGSAALLVMVLRAGFARDTIAQAVVAAIAVFLGFAAFALATRAFGMGDVKLAALLGLLLGGQVLTALLICAVAGGFGAGAALAVGRANRRATIPYGPYLSFGAAVTILLFQPPPFV